MKVYHNYHNTGGTHDAEFILIDEKWFVRLRWDHDRLLPMKKMEHVVDGTGQLWSTITGTGLEGKPYEISIRLVPVNKTTRWNGNISYPPLEAAPAAPVPSSQTNEALPPPRAEPNEGTALTMSGLLKSDSSKG